MTGDLDGTDMPEKELSLKERCRILSANKLQPRVTA